MTNEAREQLRREDCRHEVLHHLYQVGMSIARSVDMIRRSINRRGADFTHEEVEQACLHRTSMEHFQEVRAEAGATRHYKITAAGIQAYEASLV